jgi:CubicO group peptidase (beta-lactamase class C family)
MNQTRFRQTDEAMRQGLQENLFTAAALIAAREDQILYENYYGTLGGDSTARATKESLFDLASLTKPLATAPSWMILAAERPRILHESLAVWRPDAAADKADITPMHLLAHSSGLPAWRPYYLYQPELDRCKFTEDKIMQERLEFPPGTGRLYSDLGFMLLGFIWQKETGESLDVFASSRIYEPLGLARDMMFLPRGEEARTALTRRGDPPGVVNDLNARALGRVAGHAGLFGTARAVAAVAAQFLRSIRSERGFFDHLTARLFATRVDLPGGKGRALGFDAPAEGASCGRFFSDRSLGHTGFTGTSLWIDPESDLIVVLLTNRVVMGESDFRIKSFRPLVHDIVVEDARRRR